MQKVLVIPQTLALIFWFRVTIGTWDLTLSFFIFLPSLSSKKAWFG